MPGELARHIQLETELADIADAMGSHVCHSDLDRGLRCEGEGGIGADDGRKALQEDPSTRSHHREARLAARHVDCRTLRRVGSLTLEPSDIATKGGGTRYDKERRLREPRHRHVRLDA